MEVLTQQNTDSLRHDRFQLLEREPLMGTVDMKGVGTQKTQPWKRTFDLIGSVGLACLILSWLLPLIVVLQKLLNPGPVLYSTLRTGRNGKEFICYKFRTMVNGTGGGDGRVVSAENDNGEHQITAFGHYLRKTNLDELPQFFNVLKGEMSIIGPRPHDVRENIGWSAILPQYHLRHEIRPGITGWAQVNGYHGTTTDIDKMRMRTDYDLWYIEHSTFPLDLKIFLRTAWIILKAIFVQLRKPRQQ
jgi:putative colanic acid biosysnthesis UDP-glucose lipid carrier transferase